MRCPSSARQDAWAIISYNIDYRYIFIERAAARKEAASVNESNLTDVTEVIRQACVEAALGGYEDALSSGLCREGAWEAAVSAIRRLDLGGVARQISSPGPPAAGSGVASTGAIAAGLVEWAAGRLDERPSGDFRQRAHRIRGRAAVLRSTLADAARQDAEIVGALLDARERDASRNALVRAAESALEIATRCSQAVTLAVELTPHAHRALRLDVEVALRLGWNASQCALVLFEANIRSEEEGTEWLRNVNRRAWRVRLLLQRASPLLRAEESE